MSSHDHDHDIMLVDHLLAVGYCRVPDCGVWRVSSGPIRGAGRGLDDYLALIDHIAERQPRWNKSYMRDLGGHIAEVAA